MKGTKRHSLLRPFRGPPPRSAPGAAPGTLEFDRDAAPPDVRLYGVSPDELSEATLADIGELDGWIGRWPVLWIDMVGVGRGTELRGIGDRLSLHPLALEDVVNLGQRAKVERFDNHMFVVARMAHVGQAATEQLSVFIGDGWVVTVQEREGDSFEPVRARLREKGRRIRTSGADYLAYALLDSVVDSYFPVLDEIGDRLEILEEEVLANATPETSSQLHTTRRHVIALRKAIVPHRDVFQTLSRDPHPLITETTQVFFRDVYDHVLRLSDLVETYRELTGDMMSLYMTVVSNRMNEIMKVLTIIASVFIPLGFIAGLYGMNFDPDVSRWNMPELGWRYGYPFALGLMTAVAGTFLVWIWRKGWLR